nr:metal-dependent hydrolase [Arsenicicoccus dermatophilus]
MERTGGVGVRGATHAVMGITLGAAAAAPLGLPGPHLAAWTATTTVFALAPDLDTRRSIASRHAPVLSWAVRRTTGHRGWTHRASTVAVLLTIGTLMGVAIWTYTGEPAWWIGAASATGAAIHILGDALTRAGVPWRDGRITLTPLRADSDALNVAAVVVSTLICAAAWRTHLPTT